MVAIWVRELDAPSSSTAWSQSGLAATHSSGCLTGAPWLAEMLNFKHTFSSSLSLTRATLYCWLRDGHGERHAELLLCDASTYDGQGRLYDGPQAAVGHRHAARCVSLQALRRGATKELCTAMALLDTARSTRWLLRLPGNRGWTVSHGPEASWHNVTRTLVFCVCEPMCCLCVASV